MLIPGTSMNIDSPFHDGFTDGCGASETQLPDICMVSNGLPHNTACKSHIQMLWLSLFISTEMRSTLNFISQLR